MRHQEPPRELERLIELFVPPHYRDQVLGDLRERYRSKFGYICDAASAVPASIFSQIRRRASASLLLLEASSLFLSYTVTALCLGRLENQTFNEEMRQVIENTVLGIIYLQIWRVYPLPWDCDPQGRTGLQRADVCHAMYFSTGSKLVWWIFRGLAHWQHIGAPITSMILGQCLSVIPVSMIWNFADTKRSPLDRDSRTSS